MTYEGGKSIRPSFRRPAGLWALAVVTLTASLTAGVSPVAAQPVTCPGPPPSTGLTVNGLNITTDVRGAPVAMLLASTETAVSLCP
jgi:hypothetical protein